MKHSLSFAFIILLLFLHSACSNTKSSLKDHVSPLKSDSQFIAIKNVNVIPMTVDSEVITNANVIIRGNVITAVNGPIPSNAIVIDGSGKWLLPGLVDMHVHNPTDLHFGAAQPTQAASFFFNTQDIMTPYVANGVTTVFELSARPEHFAQRNEIAKQSVIGPRMALAALIDGGEGAGRRVNTASDGRQAVRSAKAEGYEFIKVYSSLNAETFFAIVDEAGKQGMRVIGHIPNSFQGRLADAFVPNYGMVAHAEELAKHTKDFSEEDAERFAQLLKKNGTWLSPTLITMVWILSESRSLDELRAYPPLHYVHPLLQSKWLTANNYNRNTSKDRVAYFEKMVAFNKRLVRACKAAGVPIVVGTDTGTSGLVAGFSTHDELELLVDAGLTPAEALASATRLPAAWLTIQNKVGTIEPGKAADLILLNSNPLSDIKNSRDIFGVFVDGRWLPKVALDSMLNDLETRNKAAENQFDWKKTIGR